MRKMNAGSRLFGRGPLAAYVIKRQRALLAAALPAGRGASLLEVNSGAGAFLPFYRGLEFDVCACEASPARRRLLQEGMPWLEIYAAKADDLPLPDDFFDWVVYRPIPEDGAECLGECLRVARRGLLVAFWNSFSPAALLLKMAGRQEAWPVPSNAAPKILRLAKSLAPARLGCRSCLIGPAASWREDSLLSFLNGLPLRACFGAWCVISLEPGAGGAPTPLGLRTRPAIAKPLAALEYRRGNLDAGTSRFEAGPTETSGDHSGRPHDSDGVHSVHANVHKDAAA